jgi:hypothetical protein
MTGTNVTATASVLSYSASQMSALGNNHLTA